MWRKCLGATHQMNTPPSTHAHPSVAARFPAAIREVQQYSGSVRPLGLWATIPYWDNRERNQEQGE